MARTLAFPHIPASRPAPRLVSALVDFCKGLTRDLFDPYRPERHYMRGPGPKWHAKHAPANMATAGEAVGAGAFQVAA